MINLIFTSLLSQYTLMHQIDQALRSSAFVDGPSTFFMGFYLRYKGFILNFSFLEEEAHYLWDKPIYWISMTMGLVSKDFKTASWGCLCCWGDFFFFNKNLYKNFYTIELLIIRTIVPNRTLLALVIKAYTLAISLHTHMGLFVVFFFSPLLPLKGNLVLVY